MGEPTLSDITQVCRMFGISSRTLRFYEEKGIVSSTEKPFSTRRHYTPEQIEHIRRVLILRSLGLPVRAIAQLQKGDLTLQDAIVSRKAAILASLDTKYREIDVLSEVLARMERGEHALSLPCKTGIPPEPDDAEISRICALAVVEGDASALYRFFSERLRAYMPQEVYMRVRADTLRPLGEWQACERAETAPGFPNIVYHYMRYEHLGLRIKFVFHAGAIDGFWLSYYELPQRGEARL